MEIIMSFRALKVTQNEDGSIEGHIAQITDAELPQDGDVLVDVDYSNLNFKDGLCMTGGGRLVRDYPHIPGVDMAGTVVSSSDDRYKSGDKVVVTGWRYGEIWWGGYAERTRVKADWCVPLPDGMTSRRAMSLGTAGLTAGLAIMALESHGLKPEQGDVLVTGAAGGVGSLSVAMLAKRGYSVAAVTGRPETTDYLTGLGASKVVPREELTEPTTRPMESALWAGCIDNVGGATLSRLLGQMDYGASVAAIGNAGGIKLDTTVLPFLLRGVNLLGIDSVMQPYERRIEAWKNIAAWMPFDKLDGLVTEARLDDMMGYAEAILKGQVQGRVLVNPKASS
jgi:acrylyl-CoA reductase (NADPH)